MQLSTMRSESRNIFGEPDSDNSHVSESELNAWANEFYRLACTRLGVLPMKERDYTTDSTGIITLNARTLSVDQAYLNKQPENKYSPLIIVDQATLDSIDPTWISADSGIPEYFVRRGTFSGRLYPKPNTANQSQTLRTHGMEFPADMTLDADIPDLPLNIQDLFPFYMAYKAFEKNQDKINSEKQLIIVNSVMKAQRAITTRFSIQRNRWIWQE